LHSVAASINEWTGGRYFLSNGSREGLLSADKLMFRLRKASKADSKLLRPFFGLNIQRANVFIKLKTPFENF